MTMIKCQRARHSLPQGSGRGQSPGRRRSAIMLHLNLFVHGRGHHEAAWRHPSASALALTDIDYYTGLARTAEAGCFDSVFLADQLAAGDDIASAPRTWLEPVTTLA